MKRRFWTTWIVVAGSLSILGCEANKDADSQQAGMGDTYDALAPADTYSDQPTAETYVIDTDPAYAGTSPYGAAQGGEVYVVQRKDTLYSIARTHYGGDHTKWRKIYEANRERISDPNRIHVGMKLIIPGS